MGARPDNQGLSRPLTLMPPWASNSASRLLCPESLGVPVRRDAHMLLQTLVSRRDNQGTPTCPLAARGALQRPQGRLVDEGQGQARARGRGGPGVGAGIVVLVPSLFKEGSGAPPAWGSRSKATEDAAVHTCTPPDPALCPRAWGGLSGGAPLPAPLPHPSDGGTPRFLKGHASRPHSAAPAPYLCGLKTGPSSRHRSQTPTPARQREKGQA